jgi:putative glycosyltransferase
MKISVVATLYYSAPYIQEFYERITAVVQKLTTDYEIIFVNDGSPDQVLDLAYKLHKDDHRVKILDLSRNFGHHKAIMTGLAYAQGDLVYLTDIDLEEKPELLAEFYELLQQNADTDVVYGVQRERQGTWSRRVLGGAFYRLFNIISDIPVTPDTLMSRLMTKRYVESLTQHREKLFMIAGLWQLTGFKQIPLLVEKGYKGSSTYSFRRKIAFLVYSVTAFSSRPLIFIAYLGMLLTIPSACMIVFFAGQYLFFKVGVDGWTSVIVSLWFLGGLIIFNLGIIAVYLSVIFTEVKQRPYTVVRQIYDRVAE